MSVFQYLMQFRCRQLFETGVLITRFATFAAASPYKKLLN